MQYRAWGFVILAAYLILLLLNRWSFVVRKEIIAGAALVAIARQRIPSLWIKI